MRSSNIGPHKEDAIFRISIHDEPRETRFKLEGKLAHEWALEAEKAWADFAGAGTAKPVVMDLCGVSFVDGCGERFLARVYAAGGKLVGCNPMINTLIEEIASKAQRRRRAAKGMGDVLTLWLLSLLFAVLAF